MTDRPRRILHIGQRKTGTTWLQRGARKAAEEGKLVFEHGALLEWSRSTNAKAASAADYAALAALLPESTPLPVFASCETLIVRDPARMAEAIARRWPDAHILVTTRAPQDYLLSSFRNDSATGHEGAAAFSKRFGERHMMRSHALDGIMSAYAPVLGPDHVHFLPYELLRDDRAGYIRRVEALVGIPMAPWMPDEAINASPPPAFLLIARTINGLIAAEAPGVLQTREWISFMRIATVAAASATGMEEFYVDFVRASPRASDTLPKLDQPTRIALAKRMQAIAAIPDFAPYLRRYGFHLLAAEGADRDGATSIG